MSCDLPEFNGALGVVASLGGISKLTGAFSSLTLSGMTGSSRMNLTTCKYIIKIEPYLKSVVQLRFVGILLPKIIWLHSRFITLVTQTVNAVCVCLAPSQKGLTFQLVRLHFYRLRPSLTHLNQ